MPGVVDFSLFSCVNIEPFLEVLAWFLPRSEVWGGGGCYQVTRLSFSDMFSRGLLFCFWCLFSPRLWGQGKYFFGPRSGALCLRLGVGGYHQFYCLESVGACGLMFFFGGDTLF